MTSLLHILQKREQAISIMFHREQSLTIEIILSHGHYQLPHFIAIVLYRLFPLSDHALSIGVDAAFHLLDQLRSEAVHDQLLALYSLSLAQSLVVQVQQRPVLADYLRQFLLQAALLLLEALVALFHPLAELSEYLVELFQTLKHLFLETLVICLDPRSLFLAFFLKSDQKVLHSVPPAGLFPLSLFL